MEAREEGDCYTGRGGWVGEWVGPARALVVDSVCSCIDSAPCLLVN